MDSISLTISSTANVSSSPAAITFTFESLVTPSDKTPIRLFTFAFFPLYYMLISDLKDDDFFTTNVAGLACIHLVSVTFYFNIISIK